MRKTQEQKKKKIKGGRQQQTRKGARPDTWRSCQLRAEESESKKKEEHEGELDDTNQRSYRPPRRHFPSFFFLVCRYEPGVYVRTHVRERGTPFFFSS